MVSNIRIEIVTIHGEIIATPLNQTKQPGSYTQQWNASNTPPGTYICRIITDNEYGMVKESIHFQVIK